MSEIVRAPSSSLVSAAESLLPLAALIADKTGKLRTPKSYPKLLQENCLNPAQFLWRASQLSTFAFDSIELPALIGLGGKSCLASVLPVRDIKDRITVAALVQLKSGVLKVAWAPVVVPTIISSSACSSLRELLLRVISDPGFKFEFPKDRNELPDWKRGDCSDWIQRITHSEIHPKYWQGWLAEWVLLGHSPMRLRKYRLDGDKDGVISNHHLWAEWKAKQTEALNQEVDKFADTLDPARIAICRKFNLNYDTYNWLSKTGGALSLYRAQAIESYPAFSFQIFYSSTCTKLIDRGVSFAIPLQKELGFSASLIRNLKNQDSRQIPYRVKTVWQVYANHLNYYERYRCLPKTAEDWEVFRQAFSFYLRHDQRHLSPGDLPLGQESFYSPHASDLKQGWAKLASRIPSADLEDPFFNAYHQLRAFLRHIHHLSKDIDELSKELAIAESSAQPLALAVKKSFRQASWRRIYGYSEEWQRKFIDEIQACDAKAEVSMAWEPLLPAPHVYVSPSGWTLRELMTSGQLTFNGLELEHCVKSYVGKCVENKSRIFALEEDEKAICTVELEISGDGTLGLAQAKGRRNAPLPKNRREIIQGILREMQEGIISTNLHSIVSLKENELKKTAETKNMNPALYIAQRKETLLRKYGVAIRVLWKDFANCSTLGLLSEQYFIKQRDTNHHI